MTRYALRRRSTQRGSALVEFAISFSFLFSLLYGTFQFGYAFFIYNELQSAVRNGARYASYRTYDASSSTPTSSYTTAVANVVVYGDPAGGTRPLVPNLTTSNIQVSVLNPSGGTSWNGSPGQIKVSITGYNLNAVFTTFRLEKPSASFPYIGRFAPQGV